MKLADRIAEEVAKNPESTAAQKLAIVKEISPFYSTRMEGDRIVFKLQDGSVFEVRKGPNRT